MPELDVAKQLGREIFRPQLALIPIHVQAETHALVFRASGVVARLLRIALDMRLAHA